jgi:hypothetical protein
MLLKQGAEQIKKKYWIAQEQLVIYVKLNSKLEV